MAQIRRIDDAQHQVRARPATAGAGDDPPRPRCRVSDDAGTASLPGNTAAAAADRPSTTLISSAPHAEPAFFNADARLLVHTMPSITGTTTQATSLLFVSRGKAPVGGWPIIAWAHGTTTPDQKTCAPSLTPQDLDGGLTATDRPE